MSFDHRERNGTRIGLVNKENLRFNRGPVLRREERILLKNKINFWSSDEEIIAMNGRDHVSIDETTSPFDERPISDEWSGFKFIARVRRGFDFYRPLDFHHAIVI